MLYDPKWGKSETKPDVFSLAGLVAWLETMPAARDYDFGDCQGACLLGQYMASIGTQWDMEKYHEIANKISGRAGGYFLIGATLPHTFGAALERARKLAFSPVQP